MVSLILSILSSTIILIIFKVIERQKLELFAPIAINYLAAALLGFYINGRTQTISTINDSPWLYFSLIIGLLLIINFFLIGISTQKSGVAITTVAAKLSFVIPVLFSLIYDVYDTISLSKIILISLAMVSVYLVIIPSNNTLKTRANTLYPILIFFGLGLLDSLIKYCQYTFVSNPQSSAFFSAVNFSIAGILGFLVLIFNQKTRNGILQPKVWILGALLGIANFGSMYFLINALNQLKFNNSMVFGINNIGVVIVSVFLAIYVYHEKFSRINWIGLMLTIFVLLGMIKIFA